MFIYLVQHAEAKSKHEDIERGLSDQGLQDIQRMATFLQGRVDAGHILHSGKKRARQTAEVLADILNIAHMEATPDLGPMADPGVWSAHLASMTENIMLVGHLPHMSRLAALLLSKDARREVVQFQTGCVVCLKKREGGWTLYWMVVPEHLQAEVQPHLIGDKA